MYTCYICLGSNYDKEQNLSLARKKLKKLFPAITFGKEIVSEPLSISRAGLFLNQVARIETDLDEQDVRAALKCLERTSGRSPENNAAEIITLDIDLLIYDDVVLKPDDMKREYVIEGMQTLSIAK